MRHVLTALLLASAVSAAGPADAPTSTEPRVLAGACTSGGGLVSSEGTGRPFTRVGKDDAVHSRDVLVALPGFKADIQTAAKGVGLQLWGNLPELSSSPVFESAVVLHDSRAYDLDLTLLRGRVVLTNAKEKGAAKVWLRTEETAVEFSLAEPGTQVAVETYGRWPAGVPFARGRKPGDGPNKVWEVYVLKGDVEIKGGRATWAMAAAPGRSYFHGDSVNGPDREGPRAVDKVPDWADPKATPGDAAKAMAAVVAEYGGRLKGDDAGEVARGVFESSLKDSDAARGAMARKMVIATLVALDEVERAAELLGSSTNDEVRKAAVIGLRHWIGTRGGRDDRLYDVLTDDLRYSKAEADVVLHLLHSPFDAGAATTYETLTAYLKHRKQAVRELAHWHLVRLAPKGREIPFDASAPAAEREKGVAAWRKLTSKD